MKVDSGENTYTSAAYSNKGISGMNSGLDTENLVKAMLNDVQTKIDKQEQKQKVLEMQQEEYRSVIDQINEFKDKYFSVTGEKSLVLSSTFKSSNTESSSAAVKAVSTSEAVEGSFDVQVNQLATEAKITSSVSASGSKNVTVGGTLASGTGKMMKITAGDKDIDIDISGATSVSDIADRINKGIASYNKINGTSVSLTASAGSDGKIKYSAADDFTDIKIDGNDLTEDVKAASVTSGKVDSSKFEESGKDYKFKINDKEYTVNLKKGDDVAAKLNDAVDADGKKLSDNGITVTKDADDKLKFTADAEKISKLKIEAADDPTDSDKKLTDDLKALGFSGTQEASRTSSVSADAPEIKSMGKLSISYNGVSKDISLTDTDTKESFSEKLFQAFGSGIQMDRDGKLTAGTGKNITVKGSKEALEFIGMDEKGASNQISTSQSLSEIYGYNDTDDIKFDINGTSFSFKGSTKLSDMMSEINDSRAGITMSYNSLNDKFSITGQEMGSGSVIKVGSDDNGLLGRMFGAAAMTQMTSADGVKGTDAEVIIDGETINYSGNDIKYNGINLTLKKVTSEPVNIETSRDTDKALDTIVSFVEDYNKLIKDLNDKTHEKAEYKKYAPLTDAQKDEMSESEIKKWEEKTNKGLLSGDNDIEKFLTEMRSVLYTKVGDKKLLSDIGIESSKDWKDYGKLTIDKDKLKDALQNDMKGVSDIFTGSTGICSRLNDACKKAANTSSGSPGSLVSLAGIKGKATEKNNTINKRIDSIKDVITKLKAQYDSRKERLWKQFNSMESALGSMNSTANYFAQMMGGGF